MRIYGKLLTDCESGEVLLKVDEDSPDTTAGAGTASSSREATLCWLPALPCRESHLEEGRERLPGGEEKNCDGENGVPSILLARGGAGDEDGSIGILLSGVCKRQLSQRTRTPAC